MYRTMQDVKRANAEIKNHFFDAGTLRWFDSRVSTTLYGGRYFITSEQDRPTYINGDRYAAWGGQRRYTVRQALDTGMVETVGEFGQYATRNGAVAAIKRLLCGA